MSVYAEGKTLLELREEIEVQGLAVGPLDDNLVFIGKHPEGFLYYASQEEGTTWSEAITTLESLLTTEDDHASQRKLHDASKPIWVVLPDDLQAYIKDNHPRSNKQENPVEEIQGDEYWTVTTGYKLEGMAFREDVARLRALILQMITTYVNPYPRWQSAAALSDALVKINWEQELRGIDVPCDLDRLFPSDKRRQAIELQQSLQQSPFDLKLEAITEKFYDSPEPEIAWFMQQSNKRDLAQLEKDGKLF
jgi:UDP:flavonoid glycosyltransferase YjiC (YdhE family)